MKDIQSHRKDEHVSLTEHFYQPQASAGFQNLRLLPNNLPEINRDQINLNSQLGGIVTDYPFYIEAMTGGSSYTGKLNASLARIAKTTHLPMAVGSQSVALKRPDLQTTFSIVRKINSSGIILANIGASHSAADAQKAIDMIDANLLEIHLNAAQEIIMPEGDRSFNWLTNISEIVHTVSVPVIVKEVGFGMAKQTMKQLSEIGVQSINVAGHGGTNFAKIENERRHDKSYPYLQNYGISTVESLLESQELQDKLHILACGGIRNPLDMLKGFCLGADMIGVAGRILHELIQEGEDQTVQLINTWQTQLADLLTLQGAQNIKQLNRHNLILDESLRNYCEQRKIEFN
ncbi:type 2 isopentenyl-diphosphate Delta-isomerase [Pediococcus ethanolidurans]|uniref:type 2 isopentenyl-diphosphate Delta-isomerase n=1 Tax=Pediococcus ethanolidurans TaxID=319653 RepID=UPI001C1EB16C|nr:type 2 isopentenyl-diphosphate Delta-isomerase [Pediococcus ethanolidurans]MBU7555004.1 type 2 isopentenyl-diphosphate Delta-isomerase [Pediococcus ethanolidurans]MBU7563121.1 type 2 isopentenyl-diphosphate Delta-isomerase [Pediococcus ethanolidurans]MCT4398943.1 type 2 isopentenyl-diphosphate Delta-isomerase [Pediococcus ethanolidurans]MCV3314959.1 type 2 isopentenyl-diphosphate Delta-isomerase [Pediococcus ethanolidurans]MCV3321842.1 type 2 isopentenyl-diphosphate Delta-isomerase [Pedioco